MRALLRQFAAEVQAALQRLDAKLRVIEARPVAERVIVERTETVREVPKENLQEFVESWLESNPLELDAGALEPLVEKAVQEYLQANPPKDGQTPDVQLLVAQYFEENPLPEPKDGQNGEPGLDGKDGKDGKDGSDGRDGRDGIDGKDGLDGAPGRDGIDGRDGNGIKSAQIFGNDLLLTFDDGRVVNVGRVVGFDGESVLRVEKSPGKDGADGVGIDSIEQESDTLVIRLTNGAEKRFKLPRGKSSAAVMGSGVSEARVIQLIAEFAPAGGGGGTSEIKLQAATNIVAYKIVTTDSGGLVIYASSSNAAHVDQVLGISTNSVLAGHTSHVKEAGLIHNNGWNWVPGEPLFLGVEGEVTRDPGTGVFSMLIGYARTAHEINLRIGRGILRAA